MIPTLPDDQALTTRLVAEAVDRAGLYLAQFELADWSKPTGANETVLASMGWISQPPDLHDLRQAVDRWAYPDTRLDTVDELPSTGDEVARWLLAEFNAHRSVSGSRRRSLPWAIKRDELNPEAAQAFRKTAGRLNEQISAGLARLEALHPGHPQIKSKPLPSFA